MIESLLTEQQERLRDKVRALVKGVPRLLLLEMDADRVQYPREFVEEAARRGLLGLRFPREYGGGGLNWTDEIVAIEEVGVLGTALSCACVMPCQTPFGLHLRRGPPLVRGTPEQKERWLRLAMIWTGTNEIMNLIIQHEYYQEVLPSRPGVRDVEADAAAAEKEF